MTKTTLKGRDVYIVDGSRTPFLKARTGIGPFTASDLAVKTGQQLLNRQSFNADAIDEVILGSAMAGPDEANIARVLALRLGCGHQVPAFTVMRNCASGMQALDNAAHDIASNRADLVLAGGADAMSHAPLLFNAKMVNWLAAWYLAKAWKTRAQLATQIRPSYFAPIIALLRGLRDPVVDLTMGQTAENIAYRFGISRAEMDAFSVASHQGLLKAQEQHFMNEITPIIDDKGQVYSFDDGVRPDSSVAKLAKLKPFFDKKFGAVTPGNSSQITDGAALLLLASAKAVKEHDLPVLGRIVDIEWAGLDPAEMGLGPVHASAPIMKRHALGMDDIDFWEINEAFAAQVLGCVRAFNDRDYCRDHLGFKDAIGEIDPQKLNVDGGAIALGHPIGASGARIVLHLLNTLTARDGKRGMASICIGGGQGGAVLVERVEGISKND